MLVIPIMMRRRVEVHEYEKYGVLLVAAAVILILADRFSARDDHLVLIAEK